jgi:hypothetical protein
MRAKKAFIIIFFLNYNHNIIIIKCLNTKNKIQIMYEGKRQKITILIFFLNNLSTATSKYESEKEDDLKKEIINPID